MADQHASRLEAFYVAEEKEEEWRTRLAVLAAACREEALELSRRRRAAAGRMGPGVEACLHDLAMGGCRFVVQVSWMAASEVRTMVRLGM